MNATRTKIIKGTPLTRIAPGKTIGEFFFDNADKYHENTCQIDSETGATETFASVKQRSVRVAIEMKNRRITSDDVIVFCSTNSMDNIIPVLSTTFLGAKVASLDPTLSISHVKHLLNLVTPAMIFVDDTALHLIENSIDQNFSTQIIVIGKSTKYSTLTDFFQPKSEESDFKPINVKLNTSAFLVFSSGTTGLPKAICLSHDNLLNLSDALCNGDNRALLHFTTFYWISAIFMLILNFLAGGYRVLVKEFDAENTFKIIQKYKVSKTLIASGLAYQLTSVKNADLYDTTSLKQCFVGGSHISATQIQKTRNLFKHTHILQGYGLTEAGVVAVFDHSTDQDLMLRKPGSCGRARVTTIKVVDPGTGKILGSYEKGEIRVKSPCIMVGYYKQDASDQFDEDGFLKTGDIGYYDEDECFYIVERIKEMFKYKSWHIVPSVIENILLDYPDVSEAVVFGIPTKEEEGEIPGACVVLKENASATPKELEEYVASKVLDREKLRAGVIIVNQIPKTPSGKLQRNQMRDLIIKAM